MQHASARAFALVAAFAIVAFATVHFAPPASGQSGPGWVTLIDAKTMGD